MLNQNQVKALQELQATTPKQKHLEQTLKTLHKVLLWCQSDPKIGEWAFEFVDKELKINQLLKIEC